MNRRQRLGRVLGSAVWIAAVFPGSAQQSFTSNDGKELRAEIVAASESDVTLKRESDGQDFVVPLERLSEESRDAVAAWLAGRKANTRAARELTLSLEGGATRRVEVPAGQFLSEDGVLTLFPGDSVHLEFDQAGEPRVVAEITDPTRTMTFSMSHEKDLTMLVRKSRIQETVAMDCTHRGLDDERFFRTNLRPTEKGLASFDSWPGSVWTLRLSRFEVTDRPASVVYEERVAE